MTINDPRDISGLKLWLSAEYETAYADNAAIHTWQDLSGNANDATAAGSPVWRSATGPGSGPCVEFNGSAQSMTLPNLMSGETEGEIFATVRSTVGATEHGFWKFGTAGVNNHYPYADNLVYDDFGSNARKDSIGVGAAGVDISGWHRVNTWSKASDWSMQVDEVTKRSTGTNTVAWNTAPKIGSQSAGGAFLAYACVVLYDRKLTTGERSDLIAWLTANPNGGVPFVADPPDAPEDLAVDPDFTSADFSWAASGTGGVPDGYEVRLDGGSITDVGASLTHTFTSLTDDTTYSSPGAEVRAYSASGTSSWATLSFTTLGPPDPPEDLAVDPGFFTALLSWSAPTGGDPVEGYEVRLDGGSIIDVGTDLSYEFTGLDAATAYTLEVRSYNEAGTSSWASIGTTTDTIPFASLVIYLGPDEDMDEVFSSAHSVRVRRGLTAYGVTEKLEPGVCEVVFVDDALSPLSYDATRPGRPLRVGVNVVEGDDLVYEPIFTGEIDRDSLQIDKATGKTRLVITAYDAVPTLAGHPYTTAHAGTFAQRVTPILEDAGVAYEVHDDDPDEPTGTLPTNQQTALGQLLLARDTMHGYLYVDRFNVVQAYADDQRNRDAPDITVTDGSVGGLDYIEVDPGFDTDDLVNVLTIETLAEPDNLTETFTDEDSVTAWKKKLQTVTVNDLDAEFHWLRFTARLTGPGITVKRVRLNATKSEAFAAIAGLSLYQAIRVVRDGLIDTEQQVLYLEHEITPRDGLPPKWMCNVTTRKRELLPLRWMDVPPDITWDDLDPAMTWNTAIYWHP